MMTIMRTIIEVSDEVIASLDLIRATDKRSRAAVIREAIDIYLEMKKAPAAEAAFGLWSQNSIDGVKYQSELRNDWEKR